MSNTIPLKNIKFTGEVEPTITLKGVNIEELSKNITSELNNIKLNIDENLRHLINEKLDKINNNTFVVTNTNIKVCMWCRCDMENTKNKCSIPIKKCINNNNKVYLTIGSFCTFNCAYAFLRDILSQNTINIQPIYYNSELLLKELHNIYFPGQKLQYSKKWYLHNRNGGSLDDNNFYGNNIYKLSSTKLNINEQPFKILSYNDY